jgi:hypothetical protein
VKVKANGTIVDSQSGFRAYAKKAIDSVEVTESGMGAESEIMIKAAKLGLSITEVPVAMKYGVGQSSKLNPFIQFSDIISTVVKELVSRRPLRFVGIPGLFLIGFGLYGWLSILASYNFTREFAVGHALVYTVVLLTGIFMTTGAIVLFVIRLMIQETREK